MGSNQVCSLMAFCVSYMSYCEPRATCSIRSFICLGSRRAHFTNLFGKKSHAYYYSKECNEERERRRGARKERIYHAKIARRAACSGTGNGNVGANFDLQLCFNQLVVPPPRGHDTKWKRQRQRGERETQVRRRSSTGCSRQYT